MQRALQTRLLFFFFVPFYYTLLTLSSGFLKHARSIHRCLHRRCKRVTSLLVMQTLLRKYMEIRKALQVMEIDLLQA